MEAVERNVMAQAPWYGNFQSRALPFLNSTLSPLAFGHASDLQKVFLGTTPSIGQHRIPSDDDFGCRALFDPRGDKPAQTGFLDLAYSQQRFLARRLEKQVVGRIALGKASNGNGKV